MHHFDHLYSNIIYVYTIILTLRIYHVTKTYRLHFDIFTSKKHALHIHIIQRLFYANLVYYLICTLQKIQVMPFLYAYKIELYARFELEIYSLSSFILYFITCKTLIQIENSYNETPSLIDDLGRVYK